MNFYNQSFLAKVKLEKNEKRILNKKNGYRPKIEFETSDNYKTDCLLYSINDEEEFELSNKENELKILLIGLKSKQISNNLNFKLLEGGRYLAEGSIIENLYLDNIRAELKIDDVETYNLFSIIEEVDRVINSINLNWKIQNYSKEKNSSWNHPVSNLIFKPILKSNFTIKLLTDRVRLEIASKRSFEYFDKKYHDLFETFDRKKEVFEKHYRTEQIFTQLDIFELVDVLIKYRKFSEFMSEVLL